MEALDKSSSGQLGAVGGSNLIINYLPDSVTERELRELFGTIGPISSAKVVCDKLTGMSLGFGFVEYFHEHDAAHAIEAYDGLNFQSKRLKVTYARPATGAEGANVHVRNLQLTVLQKDVEQMFGQYGEIVRARVLNDQATGLSRGIAFVLFANRADAERACSDLNGTTVPGFSTHHPLSVRFALDKGTRAMNMVTTGTPMGPRLNFPTPKMELGTGYGAAAGGGPIRSAAPGPSRRFDPLVAARFSSGSFPLPLQASPRPRYPAVSPNVRLGLGTSAVSMPLPADLYSSGFVIFCYNLEPDAQECELWQLFGPFGAIKKVQLVYNNETKSRCKGYGFVTMLRLEEAMAAIGYLNGFIYKDRVLQVSLRTAE